ncbi:helix-turn-helix domain-containing protein [Actinoallomurus purpureus]|uniref:helix-turn-helix domain-containing protein n=1 Tax=Actinoallomurus purpureus TaxID=478114 RepID=UPI002093A078|nr:helix-turn-helix transcriptional regulator [Actinoallomurus purpureus]MCO6005155.1 helix-turn-helix domain-containing protein [Actinoallomurus purpureus]
MGNPPSPTLIKLGAAIRRYRQADGLTQAQLAQRVNYSEGWLSNLETGQLRPKGQAVRLVEKALGLPDGVLMDLHDLLTEETPPGWFRPWLDEERTATILRSFEQSIVPGLVQHEEYARALLNGDEAAVAARLERQEILSRDNPPTLRCIIDEMVLYRQVGDVAAMRTQLEHLVARASPRVTIQVVPATTNPHRSGAFTLATVDGGEVAYVETPIRGMVTSNREDILVLSDLWESIRTFTLSQQESIDLIMKVVAERWT